MNTPFYPSFTIDLSSYPIYYPHILPSLYSSVQIILTIILQSRIYTGFITPCHITGYNTLPPISTIYSPTYILYIPYPQYHIPIPPPTPPNTSPPQTLQPPLTYPIPYPIRLYTHPLPSLPLQGPKHLPLTPQPPTHPHTYTPPTYTPYLLPPIPLKPILQPNHTQRK